MRIIIFTGKGGVGKTTVASATAVLCAKNGYKTLIISTDPAHNLSDCFGVEIGSEVKQIYSNLYGLEIDAEKELEENWRVIQDYLSKLFITRGLDDIIAEEVSIFPGINELFSLLKISKFYNEKKFDVQIIDCAPTAESLALLTFPDVISWYMEKLFPIQKKLLPKVKPILEKTLSLPLPEEEVYETVEELYEKLVAIKNILVNKEVCSIRLVLNPEKIVIKETQRAFSYFHLYGLRVDAVIVNKIFSDDIEDSFFNELKTLQKNYIEAIKENLGIKALEEFGRQLYDKKNPKDIFYKDDPIIFKKDEKRYIIILKLPFVEKKDIEVNKVNNELIIKIGPYKRILLLPQVYTKLNKISARFTTKNFLEITFS
jgi:arsenite-transporting ATPase